MRGARGGYILAREPRSITVGAVVRAIEGSISPTRCAAEDGRPGACAREDYCSVRHLWMGVRDSIARMLGSTTLADLV